MSEQLDWLARNVHVWPETAILAPGHEGFEEGAVFKEARVFWSVGFNQYCATRQQWLDRRAELQNKPSWKDAPEWATHLAQHSNGRWLFLLGSKVATTPYGWAANRIWSPVGEFGEVLGDWRNTLEQRPAFHDGGHVTEYPSEHRSLCAILDGTADLSEQAVTARLQEATDNVLAAVPDLEFEPFTSREDAQPMGGDKHAPEPLNLTTLHTIHHAAFLHQGCQLLLSEPELVVFRTADGELIHCKPKECLIDPDVYGLAARLLADMSGHPVAPEHMRELVEQMGWSV